MCLDDLKLKNRATLNGGAVSFALVHPDYTFNKWNYSQDVPLDDFLYGCCKNQEKPDKVLVIVATSASDKRGKPLPKVWSGILRNGKLKNEKETMVTTEVSFDQMMIRFVFSRMKEWSRDRSTDYNFQNVVLNLDVM
ncbi:unnamed protein product [Caenorhabditis nigoni]